jgi:ParB family chromosome partitioning protein
MASVQKITLSASRDISFDKLVLSQANVRRIVDSVSIEELAEDIARRTLLQSLNVRAILDNEGKETGKFEVPAGGRRYRALELLVKQERMSKTQLVPCIVRTGGLAEEDSLAENVQRAPLHPVEQYRAFQTLRDKGLSEEDIAARFFVSATLVKQRLKLAAVSPKLLDVFAADQMTLPQLMAFTVTDDHASQEDVWNQVSRTYGYGDEPYIIRRKLTEGAVRATDKRAVFVGVDAYEAAGGVVTRDLFEQDGGGWLQAPALLDRLVVEKLNTEAEKVRAEGWKWVNVAIELPYGHTACLRQLDGHTVDLTEKEAAVRNALEVELSGLEQQYDEANGIPEAIGERIGEIETELAAFDDRPVAYDSAEIAFAGAFVSIDRDGILWIDRGYVQPEDEPRTEPAQAEEGEGAEPDRKPSGSTGGPSPHGVITVGATGTSAPEAEAEEEDGIRPLPERLTIELTAHRTVALRDALANDPDMAFTAMLHALCLGAFYRAPSGSCLEISAKSIGFDTQAPGLADSDSAKAIEARHQQWRKQLPDVAKDLWNTLMAFESDCRRRLFAHCVSLSINALHDPWNPRSGRLAHADTLAGAMKLDMATAGWSPTVANYLGRVPKARILEAVREAKDEASARLIDHLKKPDMALQAERLLAGTGWLPEPLRTPEVQPEEAECQSDADDLPAFLKNNKENASTDGREDFEIKTDE